MAKLTDNQRFALSELVGNAHNTYEPSTYDSWYWHVKGTSVRKSTLDALVRRGLAAYWEGRYGITADGFALLGERQSAAIERVFAEADVAQTGEPEAGDNPMGALLLNLQGAIVRRDDEISRLVNEQQDAEIARLRARVQALEAALRETNNMLDRGAAKVFVLGEGHRHFSDIQARIDANRDMLSASRAPQT